MTQGEREHTEQTPYGALHIRRGEPRDVERVVAIWDDVDAWLRARGIEQGVPPRPMHDIVTDRIAAGKLWVAWRDGAALGTITLEWEDDGVWLDLPERALYVHGLATRRSVKGQGVGLALLRWAEGVARAAGSPLLRLDCAAENPALRTYYERAGFVHRGDFARRAITMSRYEKRIDDGGWS